MISVNTLVTNLENLLNSGTPGVTFRLFTDTGKYQEAERNYNSVTEYINGIASVTSSNTSNTNDGLEYGTMTLRVEMLVRCKDTEEDVYQDEEVETDSGTEIQSQFVDYGNDSYIQTIRGYLDNVLGVQTFSDIQEGSQTFNVSVGYGIVMSGIRSQNPHTGDSYTFIFYAYYNIIQSGENSRLYTIFVDGEQLPYSAMTLRRVPTQENNVYSASNDATARAINSNTLLGISLECPSIISEFSTVVKNYILNGEDNVAHILTLTLNNVSKNYIVIFGEADLTAQNILNVAQTLSFVETVESYGIISFPNTYNVYQYTGNNNAVVTADFNGNALICNLTQKTFISGENTAQINVNNGDLIVTLANITNAENISFTVVQNGV